mgnify:CR=1 FL=1
MENLDFLNFAKIFDCGLVEIGKNYAVLITTNAGLWRYKIGDTVRFTSKTPYRFKITGRTKSFINAFGEEVVVENTEQAIRAACHATHAEIADYTAGPIFMEGKEKGGHEWVIEFKKAPDQLSDFVKVLDDTLKSVNSDYEAKRYKNMTLQPLQIHKARRGLFYQWLSQKGKLGGQHKVPRLSNSRTVLEELLDLNN